MDPKPPPSAAQGQRVRELRKRTHLSRRAFSEKHGIPKGSLQNWEDGRYSTLSKPAIATLLRAFAAENIVCTADYLLHGTELPQRMHISEPSFQYNASRSTYSPVIERTREYARQREINEQLRHAVVSGRHEETTKLLHEGSTLRPEPLEFKLYGEKQNSLLHEAAKSGHLNIVKTLIEHGGNANIKNKLGQTPLHLAVKQGYEEIVHFLLLNGADVNQADKEGDAALAWACKAGQTAIARQLLKLGAQINNKNRNANLPIHWAAMNGFDNLVKLLLEHDSKTTDKNAQGETPLSSAIKNGHVAVVQLLTADNQQT